METLGRDILCREAEGRTVAAATGRRGEVVGVEHLTRYLAPLLPGCLSARLPEYGGGIADPRRRVTGSAAETG